MDNVKLMDELLEKFNGIITSKDVENSGLNTKILEILEDEGFLENISNDIYIKKRIG